MNLGDNEIGTEGVGPVNIRSKPGMLTPMANKLKPTPFKMSNYMSPKSEENVDDDMREPSRHNPSEFSKSRHSIAKHEEKTPILSSPDADNFLPEKQANQRVAPIQESWIERERKLSTFLDTQLASINFYSPVDPSSCVFQDSSGQRYMGRYLFHNKNINLLSYNCVGEKDKRPYEITFLTFKDRVNRDRMAAFLDTLRLANIPDLRKIHSFVSDDFMDKARIVLIDTFQNSINLSNLISYSEEFPEIKTMIRQDEFAYKVITIVWDTIRQFRSKGLKDLGINSNLITLLEKKNSASLIRDPVVKIRRFFKDPTIAIDYKCSHFLRLILSDEKRKNAITISDLAMINFIPKFMVEAITRYRIDFTDELAFALVIIELLKGESCENISNEIDFELGKISPELEGSLNHPFFVNVIKKCLKMPTQRDLSEYQEDFFSEANSEFMSLSRLLNSDVSNDPISLQQMQPKILASGLALIDKGKLIRILANSDYENCTPEQTSVLINFLMENNFLHYAFVYIKSSFTRFDAYNSVYNVFPFILHLIERILQDNNIKMEQKIAKIHIEDLKQILALAPNFLFHPRYESM